MDHREKIFKTKFENAALHLGVKPNEVVSLKFRDMVSSYSEYHHLLETLEHDVGIRWSKVDGNLQGQGYLLSHEKTKLIIVEHETGLEILYIAGSIASLVGLIPLVLQCWGGIRGYLDRPHNRNFQTAEIRRVDGKGHLVENKTNGLAAPWSTPLSFINTAITSAAEALDGEIQHLRKEVQTLASRVAILEKNISKKGKVAKKSSRP